jgi:hypothetical protein
MRRKPGDELMRQNPTTRTAVFGLGAAVLATAVLAALAGCAAAPAVRPTPAPTATDTAYSSSTFAVPFTVELPRWAGKQPSVSEGDFQAWEASDDNRKLRMMIPSTVFRPGDAIASPAPKDFTAYLLSLGQSGAELSTPKTVEVDGRSATLITITTRDPTGGLDGSIGCPASISVKSDCFGPQSDLKLRLASLVVDDRPVLVWLRINAGYNGEAAADAAFDRMLSTLRFAP